MNKRQLMGFKFMSRLLRGELDSMIDELNRLKAQIVEFQLLAERGMVSEDAIKLYNKQSDVLIAMLDFMKGCVLAYERWSNERGSVFLEVKHEG